MPAPLIVIAALVLLACLDTPPTAPLVHAPGSAKDVTPVPATVEVYVHAASEVWQIFMSDRTAASLQRGAKVVVIHTTAGDAGVTAPFWQAREQGALASVDAMIAAGPWACASQAVDAHPIQRCAKANAVVYFMRMPDGNWETGRGYGKGSLPTLRDAGTATSAIDGSTTYASWSDFSTTVRSIVDLESQGQSVSSVAVHAPDFDRTINPGDHPDNFATADAVNAVRPSRAWTFSWYVDYQTKNLAVNLSTADHDLKQRVFLAYDNVMVAGGFGSDATDPEVVAWLWRTYSRTPSTVPPAAPVGLQVQPVSRARIDLQWTDNASNESGFQIERAPDVGGVAGAYAQVGTVGPNVVTYVDWTLNPSTKYWFRVRAYSDGGASAYTNEATATTLATTPLPYRVDAYVQAHEDDWQIFMGDRTYASFQAASTTLLIYATAGDAGYAAAYWQTREKGSMASIDAFIGAGAWGCASRTVNAHPIQRCAKGSIVSYYMRMPDGNYDTGRGFGNGSLSTLRDDGTPTSALDGSTTYATWADFSATIGAIIGVESDNQSTPYVKVNALDYDRTLDPGDHFDHNATADALKAASSTRAWDLSWYVGYDTQNRPVNITDAQHTTKVQMFSAYDRVMSTAGYESLVNDPSYQAWLWRTYFRGVQGPSPTLQAPTNLQSLASSTTQIDLQWVDNSSTETGFRVERAPDNAGVAGTYTLVASVGANVTTYSNAGLTAGTKYWYRVQAYDATGASGYTNAASATTPVPPPPAAPSALAAQPISASQIDLQWTDNSSDETGFRVERAPNNAGVPGTYTQIASLGANVTTYSNTGLAAGTTYWYRVVAFHATGVSAYSNAASAATPVPQPPLAPSALAAQTASASQINLQWVDNSSDETGFSVERAPDNAGVPGTYAVVASLAANVTTYNNTTGLTSLTTYWYRVRAVNAGINSAYSNAASATTLSAKPAAPTSLVATTTLTTAIALDWTDNATNETGYRIERAPDNAGVAGTYVEISTVGANVKTYTTTGLVGSTKYWFRVRAYGPTETSDYSNEASATTFPSKPVAPTALAAQPISGSEMSLQWTDNSTNETGFRLERAPNNAGVPGAYALVVNLGANVTTYRNVGLAANTTYWYRVRSFNAGGTSAFTAAASGTTLIAPPLAPTTLAAKAASATAVTLTWVDNSADETGFRIEQAPDNAGVPGAYVEIGTVATNVKTYSSTGLTPATAYWYRVRAYNTLGLSTYTNEVTVATLDALPTNLTATATTISGVPATNLAWKPGAAATVDVYRNAVKFKTAIKNTGATTDTNRKVGLTYTYQVCNAGLTDAANCSSVVSITF